MTVAVIWIIFQLPKALQSFYNPKGGFEIFTMRLQDEDIRTPSATQPVSSPCEASFFFGFPKRSTDFWEPAGPPEGSAGGHERDGTDSLFVVKRFSGGRTLRHQAHETQGS